MNAEIERQLGLMEVRDVLLKIILKQLGFILDIGNLFQNLPRVLVRAPIAEQHSYKRVLLNQVGQIVGSHQLYHTRHLQHLRAVW